MNREYCIRVSIRNNPSPQPHPHATCILWIRTNISPRVVSVVLSPHASMFPAPEIDLSHPPTNSMYRFQSFVSSTKDYIDFRGRLPANTLFISYFKTYFLLGNLASASSLFKFPICWLFRSRAFRPFQLLSVVGSYLIVVYVSSFIGHACSDNLLMMILSHHSCLRWSLFAGFMLRVFFDILITTCYVLSCNRAVCKSLQPSCYVTSVAFK